MASLGPICGAIDIWLWCVSPRFWVNYLMIYERKTHLICTDISARFEFSTLYHLYCRYDKSINQSVFLRQPIMISDENSTLLKQNHQRWGYSTVTHLEQSVYLAIWKDLDKEKRKEHRKKLNDRNGEDGRAFPFFPPAFAPLALRPYVCKMYFSQCFKLL